MCFGTFQDTRALRPPQKVLLTSRTELLANAIVAGHVFGDLDLRIIDPEKNGWLSTPRDQRSLWNAVLGAYTSPRSRGEGAAGHPRAMRSRWLAWTAFILTSWLRIFTD
jgi:hypothetical protein